MENSFIRIRTFSLEFLQRLERKKGDNLYIFLKNNEALKVTSDRYEVFKRSHVCACCGIEASFLAAERFKDSKYKRSHINMYGIKNGEEVLFTKDHIVPKSKGGPDSLNNYQTLCQECNFRKGNKTIKY